ncbi:MAG: radical SAM protein [Candidatus Margulisbacteria bacterium]|nr:radical SAM protein [Candidatus Margulisiibacteriota bacterium]
MIIREIISKSVLSPSKIYDYVLNPYVGCQFGCSYCYARYMKKFTGHKEPWGSFVDIKINAVELLRKEVVKKKVAQVWISGVCDPYQPLEAKYKLTRGCLKILTDNDWPIVIQTKSRLVLRDIDIIKKAKSCNVGFSIATADDRIRQLFEPGSTPITDRINALEKLHNEGISTYAMIAPILPGAERIMEFLEGKVDYIYVDRMNYNYASRIYKANKLEGYLESDYFDAVGQKIVDDCKKMKIECSVVY